MSTRESFLAKMLLVSFSIFSIIGFVNLSNLEAAPDSKQFTLKATVMGQPGEEFTVYTWQKGILESIELITNKRCKIEIFYGDAVHSWKDALQATESGMTDLTMLWNPILPGRLPLHDLWSLPGLMPNQMTSDAVMIEIISKYPQFEKQYPDKIVPLSYQTHMRANLHTNVPIKSLSDLKGKKIACQNSEGAKMMNALGAATTVVVGPDAYQMAQTKVVQGVFTAWGWVKHFKLKEVAPYTTWLNMSPGSSTFIMNKKTFEKFTEIEQKILKNLVFYRARLWDLPRHNVYSAQKSMEGLKPDTFFSLPDADYQKMKDIFKPEWETWAKKMEGLGYPGQAILKDTIDWLRLYEDN
jgi:TRAP-type C4-dicarboxylate transport system substrate-binding protein